MTNKRKLKCKLIVSDFDGTLATTQNTVTGRNVAAIDEYVKNGGIFAVCTGRILPSIMPRVRAIGLNGLLVACQGAVIADIKTGEVIKDVRLSAEQSHEICAEMEKCGFNVQAFYGDGYYTDIPAGHPALVRYEKITGITASHTDVPVSEQILTRKIACHKFSTMCEYKDQAAVYSRLLSALGDKYDVTCSAKVLVEVAPKGEDKGGAIEFLMKHYAVPREETCAVGDNLNDLRMLRAAGYGIAVENCSPELRAQVKLFTSSNDDSGVAEVIEKYGYADND